jgi:hypothetical protein
LGSSRASSRSRLLRSRVAFPTWIKLIGPGNRFTGIRQALCGPAHCDAVQGYGAGTGIVIDGNLFEKGDTFIMMPDGSENVAVRNNVFNGAASEYLDKIQFGAAVEPTFQHNTLINVRASFDSKGSPPTTNAQCRDNIMASGSSYKTSSGDGCSNCSFSYGLFESSGDATGSSNIVGTPIFVGGASDGNDIGVDY